MAPSNKKKRAATTSLDSDKRKKTKQPDPSKPKRIAAVDSLKWRSVDLPDRLDDVEGFMGLEEVEGVDVVKGVDGKIEFAVANGEALSEDGETDAEEWNGFGDDFVSKDDKTDEEGQPEEKTEDDKAESDRKAKLKEKREKAKEKRKKDKESKKTQKKSTENEEDNLVNPFAALSESIGEDDIDIPEWEKLGLSFPTLRALQTLGFKSPTPIQSATIPESMAGHDVIGKASTGSGKTLAFGIPIMEYYLKNLSPEAKKGNIVALVLSPTRELAKQITKHLEDLSAAGLTELRIAAVTGGLSMQKQTRVLESANVVVATPGRLWEIMSEGRGWVNKFQAAKFLVIDEADRVLQEGHYEEVGKILSVLNEDIADSDSDEEPEYSMYGAALEAPKKKKTKVRHRQTLVFSATFHKGLQQKLAGKVKSSGGDIMNEKESMEWLLKKLQFRESKPRYIDIESNKGGVMADNLKEGILECGAMEKDLYLYFLLLRYPSRTLVFTNSISSVKRLVPMLNLLLPNRASPLHSSMPQKSRLRYLDRFSAQTNPHHVLVATDVAARGLDIRGIDMVLHYHVPRSADTYVHRSGRTARAGGEGISVMLCSPEEVSGVRRLVGKVHREDTHKGYALKTFDVDRALAARLKKRVALARRISEAEREGQRAGKEDAWLRLAADEFGVEYDSDAFVERKKGRGKGDRAKGKDKHGRGQRGGDEDGDGDGNAPSAALGKGELAALKAELRAELERPVNTGFSARYLTAQGSGLAQMLVKGGGSGAFLGLEEKKAIEEVG